MKVSAEKTSETKTTDKSKFNERINEEKKQEYLANGGADFNEIMKMSQENSEKDFYGVSSLGISSSMLGLLKADFIYDVLSMNQDDANFFINMVNNGQFSLSVQEQAQNYNVTNIDIAPSEEVHKSIEVSKTLVNLIEKSMQTQKPVRIDFDNNISVIMKISKDGKISADFIPSNNEVERYLRNNIPLLVQKFEEQNLPYKELTYRQYKQNKQDKKGE